MDPELDPRDRAFYLRAMEIADAAGIPYLVGGAYATERYTGLARHTKDFDLFVKPGDIPRALEVFAAQGYHVERTFPHWLAKVYQDDAFVDLIYRSGNAVALVDDEWFAHAVPGVVLGRPVRLCPAEEIIWSKAFVMERERFDGADIAHLIDHQGDRLDWARLLRRFGANWRVLLAHLTLFGFVFPDRRDRVPAWVIEDLAGRLRDEAHAPPEAEHVCRGTLLSRAQYLHDLDARGYEDARLAPRGNMTADDIALWTAGIAVDGSR
jgi:hypothetical protein